MANITGTSGNDTRVGTSNMDDIINRDGDPPGFPGTRGNDFLFGYGGADFIYGGPHNDQLFGGTGNDRLFGGTGNDLLKGGVNNDLLNGGLGTDTADYSTVSIDPPGPVGPILTIGATAGVTVNLNMQGVAQNTGGAGLDMLVGIENLIGTNFNDTLTGNGAKNVLSGLDGDDTLDGRGGIDTASYATATAGVVVGIDTSPEGNEGVPQNTGGAGTDTLSGIENLRGGTRNDTLLGDGAANTFWGFAGGDELPQVEIEIDRDAIARYALNVTDVQEMVEAAVGGIEATELLDGARRFPVMLWLPVDVRRTTDALATLTVVAPGGERVPLDRIARIHETRTPEAVTHENAERRQSEDQRTDGQQRAARTGHQVEHRRRTLVVATRLQTHRNCSRDLVQLRRIRKDGAKLPPRIGGSVRSRHRLETHDLGLRPPSLFRASCERGCHPTLSLQRHEGIPCLEPDLHDATFQLPAISRVRRIASELLVGPGGDARESGFAGASPHAFQVSYAQAAVQVVGGALRQRERLWLEVECQRDRQGGLGCLGHIRIRQRVREAATRLWRTLVERGDPSEDLGQPGPISDGERPLVDGAVHVADFREQIADLERERSAVADGGPAASQHVERPLIAERTCVRLRDLSVVGMTPVGGEPAFGLGHHRVGRIGLDQQAEVQGHHLGVRGASEVCPDDRTKLACLILRPQHPLEREDRPRRGRVDFQETAQRGLGTREVTAGLERGGLELRLALRVPTPPHLRAPRSGGERERRRHHGNLSHRGASAREGARFRRSKYSSTSWRTAGVRLRICSPSGSSYCMSPSCSADSGTTSVRSNSPA